LKPESLKKNMYLAVTLKTGKVTEAYFKKFMFKNTAIQDPKKQNAYRDTVEDILKELPGFPSD